MPHIDFSAIEEAGSYAPVPEGRYRARIIDVEESTTRSGDELWKLTFTIAEGEHEGRQVFDNLAFSPKAYPRVKLLCGRLGLDVSASVDLTPAMLMGRTCLLAVEISEYDGADGRPKTTNRVPFAGYDYDPGEGGGGKGSGDDDAVPF